MDKKLIEKELKRKQTNKEDHIGKEKKKQILTNRLEDFKQAKESIFYSCVMEECGELIQKVSKLCRGRIEANDIGLLEEIVDVELNIKLLKYLMGTDKETLKYIEDIKLEEIETKSKNGEI